MARKISPMSALLIEQAIDNLKRAGWACEINTGLPYISVTGPEGQDFFCQEGPAQQLLDEVPDNLGAETYLIHLVSLSM